MKNFPFSRFSRQFLAVTLLGITISVHAQTATDSGWVPLFNGTNLDSLYVYSVGTGIVKNNVQTIFTVKDGNLQVNSGTPNAYVATVKQYSWYRVRVDFLWPTETTATSNAGLIVHIDSAAVFSGAVTKENRPRSIEVNLRRDNDYPFSLWSAANLGPYLTSTVDVVPQANKAGFYKPGGVAWTNDPWTSEGRILSGGLQKNPELPVGQWNQGEARLYGDSGVFILNGQVRTSAWNFQVRTNPNSATPRITCTKGNIALQAEGAVLQYRRFEIMEIDSNTGLPIHAKRGCTVKTATNFDPKAVVNDGSCATVSLHQNRKSSKLYPFKTLESGSAKVTIPKGFNGVELRDTKGKLIWSYQGSNSIVPIPKEYANGRLQVRFVP